jgi:hypothetical protein
MQRERAGFHRIYPQDGNVEVDSSIGMASETVVPIRRGQMQGIVLDVLNPSRYSQTILGLVPDEIMPGSRPGEARLAVATSGNAQESEQQYRYASQAAVPPHQSRFVEISWPSDNCVSAGATMGIDTVSLRVRVFGVTRTENVTLISEAAVRGTPASDANDGATC